jgi:hypothetical protein
MRPHDAGYTIGTVVSPSEAPFWNRLSIDAEFGLTNADNRYCRACAKQLLKKLREAGYLTPRASRPYRPADKRESTA